MLSQALRTSHTQFVHECHSELGGFYGDGYHCRAFSTCKHEARPDPFRVLVSARFRSSRRCHWFTKHPVATQWMSLSTVADAW